MVGRGNHYHGNRSYTIKLTETGHIINRNSNHIKAIPITAEQNPRDQLTQHTEDPPDKILKQYEKFPMENVPNNPNNTRSEGTYINNKSGMQNSKTQGHMTT